MKLYHAPDTRSVRIVWLLEELSLTYELERFTLGDPAMRAPDYLNHHPMGRVPLLEDGEVTLFESGAITQYIIDKYSNGRLQPASTTVAYPLYLQWLHYAEGMIMPQVNIIVVETVILPKERSNETNVKRATKLLTQSLITVEKALEGRDFLTGEFSGADIMTGHATIVAKRYGADISDKPNIAAYIDRLEAREALQKARQV